ncbi:hypothetical protein D3C87_257480 [compost metagenome]
MKIQLAALVFLFGATEAYGKCVPAHEYVPFIGTAGRAGRDGNVPLGMYSRISPDGRFVMRSFSGDNLSAVTLMEIVKQSNGASGAKAYLTDFDNEAFPVQGSWRFLVNVDGSHYRLADIVKNQKNAKRQFRGGISGFYTAAAELPGATDRNIRIRSLSWPNSSGADGVDDNQGKGQLTNKTLTVRKSSDGNYDMSDSTSLNYMCSNLRSSDGTMFTLPMISTDGMEFAALPINPKDRRSTMRIYRFGSNGKDCSRVDDLNVAASKAIFGFPQTGKKSPVVFLSSGMSGNKPAYGIHLYDRNLKKTFFVGDRAKQVNPDSFPGMTKDGRIIYGAKWKDCASCAEKTGYVITDFYQSEDFKRFRETNPDSTKALKACVTEEDVAKVQAAQASLYGLK